MNQEREGQNLCLVNNTLPRASVGTLIPPPPLCELGGHIALPGITSMTTIFIFTFHHCLRSCLTLLSITFSMSMVTSIILMILLATTMYVV